MEPGVLDPVCQQAAAADGTKCQFACEARDSMPAQLDGLSRILGARAPAHNFVAQDWETQPAIISSANQQHAQHPPLPAQQQLGSTASNSSKASSAAEQLEAYLTPEVVLRELLQGALHCPVLPAILLDPVQVGAAAAHGAAQGSLSKVPAAACVCSACQIAGRPRWAC